jgi:hypothetical protein
MRSINRNAQDYFIKMAPDLSIFTLIDKYISDNGSFPSHLQNIFQYNSPINSKEFQSIIHRGMFLVYTTGNITIENFPTDSYTVFPYYNGSQVVIAIKDSPIKIVSTTNITLIIGVAF